MLRCHSLTVTDFQFRINLLLLLSCDLSIFILC